MCLDTITKTGLNKSGFGWKVFDSYKGKLYSELSRTNTIRLQNRWMKAAKVDLLGYTSGFHILLKKKDAMMWGGSPIRKVKYRKGHTKGIQTLLFTKGYIYNIIVADEMLILPEKKKGDK